MIFNFHDCTLVKDNWVEQCIQTKSVEQGVYAIFSSFYIKNNIGYLRDFNVLVVLVDGFYRH